jgi:hypothetical protein
VPERRADEPAVLGIGECRRTVADAALRHVASALARLGDGGRLVAITGASFARITRHGAKPSSASRSAAGRVLRRDRRRVYAKHGTQIETRLTVIDKLPADDPTAFPASPGMAPDVATLLDWVTSMCLRRAVPYHR